MGIRLPRKPAPKNRGQGNDPPSIFNRGRGVGGPGRRKNFQRYKKGYKEKEASSGAGQAFGKIFARGTRKLVRTPVPASEGTPGAQPDAGVLDSDLTM